MHDAPISESHAVPDDANEVQPASGALGLWLPVFAAMLGLLSWSYWPVLVSMWRDWQDDPNYSAGQLVVPAALLLAWHDRRALLASRIRPCWWGLGLLGLALAARLFGLVFLFESAERYSMMIAAGGVILLIGGRELFWRSRWILVFLALMVPLPGVVNNRVAGPLQDYATAATEFVLEIFGVVVTREGNVLSLNDNTPVGIAEACSGLRMLTAFLLVAGAFAYIIDRPRWQRLVVLASSIPVAIVCNVARTSITAGLYLLVNSETAEVFFHDFAGLLMMPLAVALVMGELWLMKTLVIPDSPRSAAPSTS